MSQDDREELSKVIQKLAESDHPESIGTPICGDMKVINDGHEFKHVVISCQLSPGHLGWHEDSWGLSDIKCNVHFNWPPDDENDYACPDCPFQVFTNKRALDLHQWLKHQLRQSLE